MARRKAIVKVHNADALDVARGLILLADYRHQVLKHKRPLLESLNVARRAGLVSEFWKAFEEIGPVDVRGLNRANVRLEDMP